MTRWFECVGCGLRDKNKTHGDKHEYCPETNGVAGYWAEVPQDTPESPISAAEQDYIDSWEVYDG